MKKTLKNWFAALLLAAPMSVALAAGGGHYPKVDIDLGDQVSLQRGAQIFTNYCLSCHSASGMRFNRLTDLGLRQVDREVMEAINAFGATPWQQLFGVQLPLALPSIMAGINQTTMMALSMVVIASMIGARGLGEDVLVGIQTLNVGKGLEAGLAIVILAVVIDRITQAYGRPRQGERK